MHIGALDSRHGESLIESCIALLLVLLIFLGMFQISQAFAAREILCHAAARGARAKTVGFNWWMVEKCVRTAAIPNSGKILEPAFQNNDPIISSWLATMKPGALWNAVLGSTPHSFQYDVEMPRIPQYLASDLPATADTILNYAEWHENNLGYSVQSTPTPLGAATPGIRVVVDQNYPMKIPMHRTFYAPPKTSDDCDRLPLSGRADIENHYNLYLDDEFR